MNKKTVILTGLLILFALPSYANNPSIIGSWWSSYNWYGEIVVDYITFNPDGTGRWWMEDGKFDDSFTYESDQSTITMIWIESGEITVYDYTMNQDGTMILGIDFGYGDGYEEWLYTPF